MPEPAKDTWQGDPGLDLRARTVQPATAQLGSIGSGDLGSGLTRRCLSGDHVAGCG
jgi:hypothetical protein